MAINQESPAHSFLSQLLPFLLSFLDDALLLGLSRLGLQLPWLQWLNPILLGCTLMYWAVQILRDRHYIQQVLIQGARRFATKLH
ncbi:MAG TPA: hypothetical protein DCE56_10485 [Cyanobacteria bacterium UBA8553]|nr:hypothetical protein [Cyanobacteria bacterium UBA8553]HAJ63448.1 hypothetical protein [Cyanobacteria bacterium UBA8543]